MAVTLKDVARRTGLSTATISKHLNGIRISPENAAAIDIAVAELGYRLNTSARSLKTQHTLTIGLLTQHVMYSYSSSIMLHIQNELLKHGYASILGYTEEKPEKESELLDMFVRRQVDGIIAIPTDPENKKYRFLRDSGVPLVMIGTQSKSTGFNRVVSDNRAALDELAISLSRCGHKTAALVHSTLSNACDRLLTAGTLDAFKLRGIYIPENMRLCINHHSHSSAIETISSLLRREHPPTAIICTNLELLSCAQIAIYSHKLSIPGDITLAGFAYPEGDKTCPTRTVSSISLPAEQIALCAAERILSLIESDDRRPITMAVEIPSRYSPGFSIGPANETNIKEHICHDCLLL